MNKFPANPPSAFADSRAASVSSSASRCAGDIFEVSRTDFGSAIGIGGYLNIRDADSNGNRSWLSKCCCPVSASKIGNVRLRNHHSPFDALNACLYRSCRDAHAVPFTFHLPSLRLCVLPYDFILIHSRPFAVLLCVLCAL